MHLDDIYTDLIEKIIQEKLKVAGKTRVNRTTEMIRSVLNKGAGLIMRPIYAGLRRIIKDYAG